VSSLFDVALPFPQPLIEATIVQRANRFCAVVVVSGRPALAYVPNTGRLPELMLPGTRALVVPAPTPQGHQRQSCIRVGPARRTTHDLLLVQIGQGLVCVDTRVPNVLVGKALRMRALPEFAGYSEVRPEFRQGHSRFDFRLSGAGPDLLVEVKSVTLVQEGVGLFPDAPTERGRRHLVELTAAVQAGCRAAVLFVVQRGDAHSFSPNDGTDLTFGTTLRAAVAAGVEVHTYGCEVNPEGIWLRRELPIRL